MEPGADPLRLGTQMWAEHKEAPYPPRLRGEEIAGVEMILLDADIAGCFQTWLNRGGQLDEQRWNILAQCRQELTLVLVYLSGSEHAYFEHLQRMADLVLGTRNLTD